MRKEKNYALLHNRCDNGKVYWNWTILLTLIQHNAKIVNVNKPTGIVAGIDAMELL